VVGSVGGIERLTVAVLINEKAMARAAGGAGTGQDLGRFERVVRDAIGIDSARGDRITVLAQPFEPMAIVDSAPARGGTAGPVLVVAQRFSRPIVGIVGIVAALILGLRVLRTGREPTGRGTPESLAAGGMGGTAPGALAQGAEPGLPPVSVPALSATTSRLKSEVQAESTQRPEMAASVVKAWLAESA